MQNISRRLNKVLTAKISWRFWLRVNLVGFAFVFATATGVRTYGEELQVLSSMSPSFTETFVQEFKSRHPEIDIVVLNKNTNSAIEEILRGNMRNFDVFWASSPEAFSVLEHTGQFRKINKCQSSIKDSSGIATFAYSGLGWSQNTSSQVRPPKSWQDLLSSDYEGQIGIARPSRSGTAHMLVEYFLQVYGWEKGWAYLLELSGNFSTITARSFSVPDGLINNRFSIGVNIDFLAQSLAPVLEFTYGDPIVILPAQIGILNNKNSNQASCSFVDFILSQDAQKLLLNPDINRIPADPSIRAKSKAINTEIETAIKKINESYDANIAQSRYWAVNALFDIFIVENLSRRRALLSRLKLLSVAGNEELHAHTQIILTSIDVLQETSQSEALNSNPFQLSNVGLNNDQQNLEIEKWRSMAKTKLDEAERNIEALEATAN